MTPPQESVVPRLQRIPRWAKILFGVFAALVVVALLVPFFVDADRYRPFIIAALEKETGRKVAIGRIRARLVPSVGFTIENFALGHPQGFAEGNFLTAEAIRGNLAWLPLLSREFQLRSLEIVQPKVALLEDDRGQTSYDFGKKTGGKEAESGGGFRLADIDSIELSEVEVTVGRVTGRRRGVVPALRAWKINATLGDVALDAKRIKQWKADSDLDGVLVEIPGLKGSIVFRSGEFRLRDGGVESKFEADLGKASRVKGSVRVADVEKAVAHFELSTPLLDLDQLLGTSPESEPAPASAPRKSELVAQGKLRAERVRWAPYEASNAAAEVRVFTDRIEVWPGSLAVYGGSVALSARVDRRQSPERFSANLEVRGLDVGKVLAASPSTRGKMTGMAELTLQVFGTAGKNLLDSLTGRGKFAIRDGSFPGFNLPGTLQSLAKVQQVLTLGRGGKASGLTSFRSIEGDLRIGEGRVASNLIHLDSPSGTVDLRGSLGFNNTLDYDGQANLQGGSAGGPANPIGAITGALGTVMKQSVGRISVPFAVRGTFSDPKIQPGRGLPSIQTSSPAQTTQQQQQPEKKKSILDIFRKP